MSDLTEHLRYAHGIGTIKPGWDPEEVHDATHAGLYGYLPGHLHTNKKYIFDISQNVLYVGQVAADDEKEALEIWHDARNEADVEHHYFDGPFIDEIREASADD